MTDLNTDNIRSQMRKGVLEYFILSMLNTNDAYASELISYLKDAQMIVVEGTIYPLLTRQKNQGLLSYRWEESTQGPPRKYYSITQKGIKVLSEMDAAWDDLVNTIATLRHNRQTEPK